MGLLCQMACGVFVVVIVRNVKDDRSSKLCSAWRRRLHVDHVLRNMSLSSFIVVRTGVGASSRPIEVNISQFHVS